MSKIEWTDETWNPVAGCSKVSPGCDNCYAIREAWRLSGNPNPKISDVYSGLTHEVNGRPNWTGKLRTIPDRLEQPLHWKKPRRIFVNSMSDLFHERLPDEAIDQVFAAMSLCPQHAFQVLTKRPDRMQRYFSSELRADRVSAFQWELIEENVDPLARRTDDLRAVALDTHEALPNVWPGASVEDQKTADERIPLLLKTPAAVRWVSYEPALGPINLSAIGNGLDALFRCACGGDPGCPDCSGIPSLNWVVAGGESGPRARPSKADWFRSVRDQCQAAGVPFFMKQLTVEGRKIPFDQWQDDLKVREYPER